MGVVRPQSTPHVFRKHVLVKLDFFNAFNSSPGDAVLVDIANELSEISWFCHLAYQKTSSLKYECELLESQQSGLQGPLVFRKKIQQLLNSLASTLALGHLDDVMLGSPLSTVATIISKGRPLVLIQIRASVKSSSTPITISHPQLAGFRHISPSSTTLFASLFSSGLAMDAAISTQKMRGIWRQSKQ